MSQGKCLQCAEEAYVVHLGQDQARETDGDGLCHVRLSGDWRMSGVTSNGCAFKTYDKATLMNRVINQLGFQLQETRQSESTGCANGLSGLPDFYQPKTAFDPQHIAAR
jgi:hypothetical protein